MTATGRPRNRRRRGRARAGSQISSAIPRGACPERHGVLLQLKEAGRLRFRRHTGHADSLSALIEEMDERIEESLWTSLRSIQERELLLREVGKHVSEVDHGATAEELRPRGRDARAVGSHP